jgi:hypothetical protein
MSRGRHPGDASRRVTGLPPVNRRALRRTRVPHSRPRGDPEQRRCGCVMGRAYHIRVRSVKDFRYSERTLVSRSADLADRPGLATRQLHPRRGADVHRPAHPQPADPAAGRDRRHAAAAAPPRRPAAHPGRACSPRRQAALPTDAPAAPESGCRQGRTVHPRPWAGYAVGCCAGRRREQLA